MALVSATEMLQKAKAGHYAVGQFNINNLEWTKAILLTAQENNSPVILGVCSVRLWARTIRAVQISPFSASLRGRPNSASSSFRISIPFSPYPCFLPEFFPRAGFSSGRHLP